jgi:hypothetical protein
VPTGSNEGYAGHYEGKAEEYVRILDRENVQASYHDINDTIVLLERIGRH